MADWAVDYSKADDTGTGLTAWANAKKTLKAATDLAASGDTIYVDSATDLVNSAVTTYTIAAGVRIISSNDKVNFPPQTLANLGVIKTITHSNYMTFNGVGIEIIGFDFQSGSGSTPCGIFFALVDGNSVTLTNCQFSIATTAASSYGLFFGNNASLINSQVTLNNVNIKYGTSTTVAPSINCPIKAIGGTFPLSSGSIPTGTIFRIGRNVSNIHFDGSDFSASTTTLFSDSTSEFVLVSLYDCKLGSGSVAPSMASASGEYLVFDCSASDIHYQFAHYAYNGSTTVSTAIYANDGAEYNIAGDKCSWVVAGNANTSRALPYISPWIPAYNEATSAITPEIEILRNSNTSAYTDIEVWSEWMLKTAGGSPITTLYSDYGGPLATGAAQGTGSATWTGATTPWIGKLECPSVTPAEIGHVSARVVVAGNHTVYVDPQIRGL